MINTITDDVIKEIEAAAAMPGSYWYESVDDLVDLFPADDGDAAFVFAATPERVAALIQRMRNAETKLMGLAVAVTGPDRMRATMMASSVIETMGKAA